MVKNQLHVSFFKDAPDPILVFDQEWNIIDINRAGCTLLEYTKNELINLNLDSITDATSGEESELNFIGLQTENSIKGNGIFKSKSGKFIPYEYSISTQSNGNIISVCRDISDRKERLATLKVSESEPSESEEQMRLFVDYAPSAVAMFDTKMNYLHCSQRWIDDWSFNKENSNRDTFIGRNHYDLFPDVTNEWKEVHKQSLKGETLSSEKEHFTNRNGDDVWLKWESHPWYNRKGKIGGVMLITELITEKVRIQEALRESEKLNRSLVEHSPMAIVIQDLNQRIVFANPKAAQIVGIKSVDELIGKSIFDFTIKDNMEMIKSRVEEMLKTGKPTPFVEQPFIHKDGTYRYGESTTIPFEYKDEPAILSVINDISAIKKVTKQLQQNEKRLREIIDLVPFHMFAKDGNGNILLANKAFAELYSTTTDYISKHKSLSKKFEPSQELKKKFMRIDKEVIKTKKSITTPIEEFVDPSGNVRYLQTTKVPYTADDNTNIKLLGISADITERIKFEEKIKKSDDRQKALLNAIPDLIFINSIDGEYLDYHALKENLLFQPEEFLGRNISDFFKEDLAEKFLKAFKLVSYNDPQIVKYTLDIKDNAEHFEARIVKYGSDQVLSIVRDITKQKNAEIALKESEENLDFYFSKSLDGFYIMETTRPFIWSENINKSKIIKEVFSQLKIVKINDSMLDQYGGSLETMMGYSLNDFFKHDLKKGYEIITDLLNEGKQQNVTEELKLDGTPFWVEGDYVCLYNEDGLVRGLFGFQRDITGRVEAEADLKNITDDLIKSNNELQQFAYLTSHDLRAPVVNINSLLNFYNKDNPLDKDNPVIIDKIENSVNQLQGTLNDLVSIVALSKQEKEASSKISFSIITKEVKTAINHQIKAAKAEITTDFKVRNIQCSKTQLNSILQNMLTNAIKYRSPKRIPKIRLQTYKYNEFICLEISDNGLGIDLDKFRNKLFGIYQRFHNAPNSKGLGLYIVKTQVEQLGGHIEVTSKVGHGTTFSIFLKNSN